MVDSDGYQSALQKEKWSPGCCTNADVVSCELRGNGNWSRYHAILRDGREIELRRVSNVLDMMETKALVQWSANETSAQIWSQLLYLMPPEIVEAAGLVPAKEFDPNITGDLKTLLRVRERDGVLSTEAQVTFVKLIYKLCHEARLMSNRTKNTAAEWGSRPIRGSSDSSNTTTGRTRTNKPISPSPSITLSAFSRSGGRAQASRSYTEAWRSTSGI